MPGAGRAGDALNYRELALALADYVRENAVTHVLFPRAGDNLPEEPVGGFAPAVQHGTLDDFTFLVDTLHQAGIGVIVDGLPGPCAEPADERVEFDTRRPRIGPLLLSNALFWLDRYHIDALRLAALDTRLLMWTFQRA